ncbi:AAA family ATPase [Flavobacterium hibernum]|uniref:Uncharacterized protein n=1 Tax=Flavobacterium hibernum TaxID=37752 RepID=A0A0D0F0Z7_9FLAO|nr:AAA family ATPase [Flavobacterium hibernum]KIO51602.1 hypothetical protein IW18_16795 [Flavobacterium hibernum]OXA86309.1 hypothetical protein B0A73_14300 [Flavobacterium hibernum]STO11247.1 cytochrome c biogenesis protein CcmA [Flavobacterium hibernum]
MKIKSVYIPDFLILKDFKIVFEHNKDLAVIIGDNGSGKSTLLEVIAYIFGHLHKYFVLDDKTAEFIDGYEIEFTSTYKSKVYEIYLKSIYISQKTNTFKPVIRINGNEMSISQIEKEFGGFSNFLPSRIGVYYAGEAKFLQALSEHFENKFIDDLIKKGNPYTLNPLNLPKERPFYYVKDIYLGLILLSLLVNAGKNNEIKKLLLKLLGEVDMGGIDTIITIKKPIWAKSDKDTLWGINSNFVEQFVHKLNATASKVDNEKKDTIFYTYYGILDLVNLFSDSEDSDYAFMVLDTLFYNGLLENISITLKKTDGTEIDSERLSEGQRQFIVTSGLSALWKDQENKLFLYDEPDVFLHPKWQREFIPFIKPYFQNSFAILTTHNPSFISSLDNSFGSLYHFAEGKLHQHKSKYYGRDVNDVIREIMGGEIRPEWAEKKINEVDGLLDVDYEKGLKNFNKLKELLSSDDSEIIRLQTKIDFLKDF